MTHQPKVAIVILNWNGRKYLEQFLPSVITTSYSNYEIIIADNNSSDDSVSFLETNYPSLQGHSFINELWFRTKDTTRR